MDRPIVVLGAGINGTAIARELAVAGLGVVVVDPTDIACGATAYSSRLIHGGLRYLEYGELDLVRESLHERGRLLRHAAAYVLPLRLHIPVESRSGGWTQMLVPRWLRRNSRAAQPRGLWLVRAGLWLYDLLARDRTLPRHASTTNTGQVAPCVDPARYPWMASYYDAQVRFPERFSVAQLRDAEQQAAVAGIEFRVFTYHRARLFGGRLDVLPASSAENEPVYSCEPAAVINATGAWVDATLAALQVKERRLMGGTKGSHLVSWKPELRAALGDDGVYVEASDGRPVFILPFGPQAVLIGTTDVRFEGDPGDAVATAPEVEYLIACANEVFPQARLSRDEIELHYAGVRPLPYSDSKSTAGITRRHFLTRHDDLPFPFYSIVGGKLTTCRALAELTVDTLCESLQAPRTGSTLERPLPGAEGVVADRTAHERDCRELAARFDCDFDQVRAMWALCGTQTGAWLAAWREQGESLDPAERQSLDGTDLPRAFVRGVIRAEWVARLEDLVERRLMLLYHRPLTRRCLEQLAQLLVEERRLSADQVESAVATCIARLAEHFGRRVT